MSDSTRQAGRVPRLPDEIIFQILGYLPDLATLFEITNIVKPGVLDTPIWGLLSRFVDRYPLQLRRIIRFVMCVPYGKVSEEKDLGNYLVSGLETLQAPRLTTESELKDAVGQDDFKLKYFSLFIEHHRTGKIPPFLILDSIHDPAAMLRDMSIVSSDLEQLVRSFFDSRLYRTHAKMKGIMTEEYQDRYRSCNNEGHSKTMHEKHWGPGYCLKANPDTTEAAQKLPMPDIDAEPAPPSPTELHRVRRAFWRLLLYSDLFHEPNPKYPINHRERTPVSHFTRAFLQVVTIWELEEIECVYYHLRAQIKLWADPQSPCYSPILASRLLTTFGPIRNVFDFHTPKDRTSSEAKSHITAMIGYYREMMCSFDHHGKKVEWPDTQDANKPNAGWLYLKDNHQALKVPEGNSRRLPVSCFLDWGYCIWDRSRLESWWLVDRRGTSLLAGKAKSTWWAPWWKHCRSLRGDCAHCASLVSHRAEDILAEMAEE